MNLRLTVELLLRRHGWPTVLTLTLLAVIPVVALLRATLPEAAPPVVPAADGSRQLDAHHRAFLALLIPRGEIEAQQRGVLDAALRHGVVAGRVDYGFENSEAGRFGVATLQMPLRGSYTDLRAFLATVLAAQPALAIRDLALRRAADGNGIEAQLKLALHTEMAPEARE
ncbi:MAG: hypothetical protein Q7U97_11260 [Rhodocyclaceae bacterium]|nr:hypothetical protein [Rhodocyclaceae bacterium]